MWFRVETEGVAAAGSRLVAAADIGATLRVGQHLSELESGWYGSRSARSVAEISRDWTTELRSVLTRARVTGDALHAAASGYVDVDASVTAAEAATQLPRAS